MKNLLTLSLLTILLSCTAGCKKIIEKQKENFVMAVMTEGQWKITRFVQANDTITSQFSAYSFQFNRDYTVDAINDGAIEFKGTWQGNPETMDITANFPTPTETIGKINGVWNIYQHSLTYVMASQTASGMDKYLRLDKK
jgi:hypothetical protein